MRPIKFRIRCGAIMLRESSLMIDPKDGMVYDANKDDYLSGCTVEQFTGLHDREGTEIYESDIVRHPEGDFLVTFEIGCFGLEGRIGWGTWHDFNSSTVQLDKLLVIGNKYESR